MENQEIKIKPDPDANSHLETEGEVTNVKEEVVVPSNFFDDLYTNEDDEVKYSTQLQQPKLEDDTIPVNFFDDLAELDDLEKEVKYADQLNRQNAHDELANDVDESRTEENRKEHSQSDEINHDSSRTEVNSFANDDQIRTEQCEINKNKHRSNFENDRSPEPEIRDSRDSRDRRSRSASIDLQEDGKKRSEKEKNHESYRKNYEYDRSPRKNYRDSRDRRSRSRSNDSREFHERRSEKERHRERCYESQERDRKNNRDSHDHRSEINREKSRNKRDHSKSPERENKRFRENLERRSENVRYRERSNSPDTKRENDQWSEKYREGKRIKREPSESREINTRDQRPQSRSGYDSPPSTSSSTQQENQNSTQVVSSIPGFKRIKLEKPEEKIEEIKKEYGPEEKRLNAIATASYAINALITLDNSNAMNFIFTPIITVDKSEYIKNRSPLVNTNNVEYNFNSINPKINYNIWNLEKMSKNTARVASAIGMSAQQLVEKKLNSKFMQNSKKKPIEISEEEIKVPSSFFANTSTQTDEWECTICQKKKKPEGYGIGVQVKPFTSDIGSQTLKTNYDLPFSKAASTLNENQMLALNDFIDLIREPGDASMIDIYEKRNRLTEIYKLSKAPIGLMTVHAPHHAHSAYASPPAMHANHQSYSGHPTYSTHPTHQTVHNNSFQSPPLHDPRIARYQRTENLNTSANGYNNNNPRPPMWPR